MPTDETAGVERLGKIQEMVESLKTTYPDAKKLHVEVRFAWQETD